jgi:hypothetical protein
LLDTTSLRAGGGRHWIIVMRKFEHRMRRVAVARDDECEWRGEWMDTEIKRGVATMRTKLGQLTYLIAKAATKFKFIYIFRIL